MTHSMPKLLILAVLTAAQAAWADPPGPASNRIELVCIDDHATGYATFQSHNQKLVSNRHGIFLAYIRSRNAAYTAQQWRLVRSTDGGRHFTTVFEATDATNPPVLETDADDNLFLARPDFVDGHAHLYRFSAADGYAHPLVSKIPQGAAGKYAMILDRPRRQLYFFSHNNSFHTLGLDGLVRRSVILLKDGPDAALQYPSLSLTPDGTLHAAWTTVKHGVYLYWDIHHMLSRDGGETWQTLRGQPVALPAIADQHGPTDRIIRDDEYEVHTWLSNFLALEGKIHFVYLAQSKPPREHYLRIDLKSGRRDVDVWPDVKGEKLELQGLDGFFASRAVDSSCPLYCVLASRGHLACLANNDNGRTWHDHAVSDATFHLYAVGGCRELANDGTILGAFTDYRDSAANSGGGSLYFFRIPTRSPMAPGRPS